MSNEIAQLEAAILIATKKLEELKAIKAEQDEKAWPQDGDDYWGITFYGSVSSDYWEGNTFDRDGEASGNVFRTEAEAQRELERRKVLTELRKLARESWGGDNADWRNRDQSKWSLQFDHITGTWETTVYHYLQHKGAVWFATEQTAQAAVETIGADRLMLLLED